MRQLIADRFDHIQDLSSFFLLYSVVHTNILLVFLKMTTVIFIYHTFSA